MTDGTAGWFRDPTDPALARWHDGQRWTEHTLVIADQAPGSEPPPPTTTPATAPTPMVSGFESAAPYAAGGYTSGPADQGLADRVRALPTWGKVVAPLVVVAVLVLAFVFASGGDSDDGNTETAGTSAATLDDAVDAARAAGLSDDISDARAAALIGRICSAATRPSQVADLGQDLGALPAATTSDLRKQIRALGVGADERCADDLDAAPGLIGDLQDAALVAYSTTTTAVTLVPDGSTDAGVDGGTDSGTTGTTKAGSRTTTTKRGTATTKAPVTTTTAKPVPKALPNQPCSPEGASGENKITGAPMSCQRPCSGGTKLTWRQGTCPTNPTTPPTQPGQTVPTNPSTTTTTTGAP